MGLIFEVFAFVLFCIAAWAWAPTTGWYYRLVAAGLAFYMAALIFGGVQASHLLGH
jgi:hypothetical protein